MMSDVRTLIELRDAALLEIEALKNRVAGLQMAIASFREKPAHGRVTETIMNLLSEAGDAGLKSNKLIDLAEERGVSLNRNSVKSLLSQMTKTGAVMHSPAGYRHRWRSPR